MPAATSTAAPIAARMVAGPTGDFVGIPDAAGEAGTEVPGIFMDSCSASIDAVVAVAVMTVDPDCR